MTRDWMGRRVLLAPLALAALLVGGPPATADESAAPNDDAETSAEVMKVLDRYLDAINAHDIEAHVDTLHFPHFRFAHASLMTWETAADMLGMWPDSTEERREFARQSMHTDWHRSDWARREIVNSGPDKVHVDTRIIRLREDRSEIVSFDSLYILTLQDGHWAIKGRSSFAP